MEHVATNRLPSRRPVAHPVAAAVGLVLASLGFALLAAQEDPFAANVRPTDPRTPAEQQRTLKVPAGFEVQLVASEPDVHKPMNLAFDVLGRLWVTTSREYPNALPVGQAGRDRVMVFQDFGPDGRARKATEFASGLNIPTGVYPFRTPDARGRLTWKALVWSIPNIWLLEDTDGDGKADTKEAWFGPFDHTRDTHGNQSSFRRGFDGWLYATHGFNNDSHVAGRDGHRIDLNSGNTYRMRLDGSRLEHFTWGQVNPFGLAWDPQGNLYSSDCHSEPIYLLLAGGYYPSFGKPHDGLGFAPNMMEAVRGSTAIDGISYYADDLWPAEYRDCVFIGDVMTSRVYRDLAEARGSGRVTRARPDFVISEDPWFRPVDTTLGPDGALYIADFYNRIIGHYEVPLNHPGRDRERGRIWRVIHRGADGRAALRNPRLAQDRDGLLAELDSPNLSRRLLAMNDLADRFGSRAVPRLHDILAGKPSPAAPRVVRGTLARVHALWLLERFGALSATEFEAAAADSSSLVRVHAFRVLLDRGDRAKARPDSVTGRSGAAVRAPLAELLARFALPGLSDADAVVRRLAASALGKAASTRHVGPLLAALAEAPASDTHLVYSLRQALRDQLSDPAVMTWVNETSWPDAEVLALADAAVAVHSEGAGSFLVDQLARLTGPGDLAARALAHAARHAPTAALDTLVGLIRERAGGDLDAQLGWFRSMQQGLAQRGTAPSEPIKAWGAGIAAALFDSVRGSSDWASRPLDGAPNTANPWEFEERPDADGAPVSLLSSFPRGESLAGVLRSRPFAAPARMNFHLAGHDGYPDKPAQKLNLVRLRDAATGQVLVQAAPPRQDTALRIEWDLAEHVNSQVVFEVVDADTAGAYAWLAFGRIEGGPLTMPAVAPANVVARQIAAAELTVVTDAEGLRPDLTRLARDPAADPTARAAAARAVRGGADALVRTAADLVSDASQPHAWRARTADVVFDAERLGAEELIAEVWKSAPHRFQVGFAGLSGADPRLAREIVTRMSEGRAPAGLLADRGLRDRLRRVADARTQAVIDTLVRALPEEGETARKLLAERRASFKPAEADPARGREIYATACAACHQINGQGGLVGPQLTGIGTRGEERLCEDILVPNRNVDHAFWTTVLDLKDGDSTTGLFRREEGELLVLANAAGAEFTVGKSDVAGRRESSLSIMPSNFGEALSPADFHHLLAYLLSQTGGPGSLGGSRP